MSILTPFTNLTSQVSGLIKGTREFMEKVQGEGLKGVVSGLLDINVESFIKKADEDTGVAVLRLTMAGDDEGVEMAIRFRNYAVMRLKELKVMGSHIVGFTSEDVEYVKQSVREAAAWVETMGGPDASRADREQALLEEIGKLREIADQMGGFIDGREPRIDSGAGQDSKETVDAPWLAKSGTIVKGNNNRRNVRQFRPPAD